MFAVVRVVIGFIALVALAACGDAPAPEPDRRVLVSVPPLVELVRPMLQPDVEIETIVPLGRSVHGYEPSPGDLAAAARAAAVVLVGAGLEEAWGEHLRTAPATASRVVPIAALTGVDESHAHHHHHDHEHDHHHHHHHHHHAVDPHLWVDPVFVAEWLPGLYDALPDDVRADRPALDALIARARDVGEAPAAALAPFAGARLVTHHAAFGRLAERYGLEIAEVVMPVETAEPSPDDIARVRRAVDGTGVAAILVEPQLAGELPRRVAEAAGLRVVEMDPLGRDWFVMMRTNLDNLVAGLSEPPSAAND